MEQNMLAATVLLAILGHVSFNRLEPRSLPAIFTLLWGPPAALSALLHAAHNVTHSDMVFCFIFYVSSLALSTILYRLSPFHPLAKFPGPIICRVTKLWALYIVYKGKQHLYYKDLHARYGTHVRTGPNHLNICDADAIPAVLGAKGFVRGGRYEVMKVQNSTGSLLSLTDVHEHAKRRRKWDRGLNINAIQGYQGALEARIKQLMCALDKCSGEEVDLSSWFSSFSFDFMGDLAFGGAFNVMAQGDVGGHVKASKFAIRHQELIGSIPWIKPFHTIFPSSDDLRKLRQFAKESVLARKEKKSYLEDIFFHLLDEGGIGSDSLPLPTLIAESSLAIVAGSDTTATALSNLFYSLIANPLAFARLREEVDATFPPGSEVFVPSLLGAMKYLNAVINETQRLYPAIPSGVQRVVPEDKSGAIVAGRWVPAPTTVRVPTHAVHRDPRYFSPKPESFCPERWLGDPNFQTNPTAFFPFSFGPMNCAGKNLALQELRMVTCSLIQKFEFEFAKGWDLTQWEKVQRDIFLLSIGRLPVLIRPRT